MNFFKTKIAEMLYAQGSEKTCAMPAIATWRGAGVGTARGPGRPRISKRREGGAAASEGGVLGGGRFGVRRGGCSRRPKFSAGLKNTKEY